MSFCVSRYIADNTAFIARCFVFSYYLLSFAFFLCPVYPIYLVIFYLCAGISGLLLLHLDKPHWLKHPILLSVYLFLLYCDATLVMNIQDNPMGCLDMLKKTAVTLGFLWLSILFFTDPVRQKRYITLACCWIIIATPMALQRHFYYNAGLLVRMELFAQAHHPIIGANVYGAFGLFALYRLLAERFTKRSWLYIAAIICILILIFLTQSKGPMMAIAGSYSLFVFLCAPTRWRWIMALAGAALVTAVCIYFMIPHAPASFGYIALMEQRGLSDRPAIWLHALRLIKEHPWFGYGISAQFQYEVLPFVFVLHPHSLYIATLYYTGIIGLILELAMLVMLGWGIVKSKDTQWKYFASALLLYLILATVSDVARLIASPKDLLFMFWLPFALIVSHIVNEQKSLQVLTQAEAPAL